MQSEVRFEPEPERFKKVRPYLVYLALWTLTVLMVTEGYVVLLRLCQVPKMMTIVLVAFSVIITILTAVVAALKEWQQEAGVQWRRCFNIDKDGFTQTREPMFRPIYPIQRGLYCSVGGVIASIALWFIVLPLLVQTWTFLDSLS